jgi:tetracycline 7-halogenase / FADH2 O2-dependent halogenase
MTADAAADLVFGLLRESAIVKPAFGWKDEEHRYIYPTASTTARYVYWTTRPRCGASARTTSSR